MALEFFLTNDCAPALAREVEEFLDSQDTTHLYQFPSWSDPGATVALLRDGGKVRWATTLSLHAALGRRVPWIRVAAANHGPVCDDQELWAAAAEQLAGQMRRERIAYIEVSPEWIQPLDGVRPGCLSTPQWECVGPQRASLRLALTPSEDELFANFRKNSRYEVRHAERLGATVTAAATDTEIDEFSALHQDLAAHKGFNVESRERARRQVRWLIDGESRGALLLVRIGNVVRGGAVIGRSGRRCLYIWGASDKRQPINVGHLLQWKALQWAKAHGCTEYDFGGYTPGATSGPAWFKAGFGGATVHFVQPHRRVIRPGQYRVFSFLSKIR